jgi:hypothetical protein
VHTKVAPSKNTLTYAVVHAHAHAHTQGGSGHSGGSFDTVEAFAAHGRAVFGPDTLVVLAEIEMSWKVGVLRVCLLCVWRNGGAKLCGEGCSGGVQAQRAEARDRVQHLALI